MFAVCLQFSGHVDNFVKPTCIDSELGSWLVFVLCFMEFVFVNVLSAVIHRAELANRPFLPSFLAALKSV